MRSMYKVWPSEITATEIQQIRSLGRERPVHSGTIFSPLDSMQRIRSCSVCWLEDDWLQNLLWKYVQAANCHGFGINVEPQTEMQLVEYRAEEHGHYDWHHDVQWNGSSGLDRKLSVTIQLSDSDDYCGGDFEFEEISTNADFRSKGTVLIFPSYLRHRIHPVTKGTRHALVAWFFGPRWA